MTRRRPANTSDFSRGEGHRLRRIALQSVCSAPGAVIRGGSTNDSFWRIGDQFRTLSLFLRLWPIEQRGAFRPQALSRLGGPPTKNPFQALLKAARMARKRSLSAARVLQQIALSPARRPGAPGTFVDGRFSSPHGGLAYKLYTPHGSTRRRLPLVVMLHGCTQSAADFALGTGMNELADELGFLALYPQQAVSANLGRCWNWHRSGDQKRGSGEPAAIAALTRHIIATCKANSARVYIAGISAGGAAAAIIASAYPEIYVAVGVHSGLVHGNVSTLRGAWSAMRTGADAGGKTTRPPPTIIFHGDQDRVVHPSNANGFLNQLQRSSPHPIISRTETGRSAGGRDFTRTVYRRRLGEPLLEVWTVHGGGHAWSGGSAAGSHADPAGPDASREMMRFFSRASDQLSAAHGREPEQRTKNKAATGGAIRNAEADLTRDVFRRRKTALRGLHADQPYYKCLSRSSCVRNSPAGSRQKLPFCGPFDRTCGWPGAVPFFVVGLNRWAPLSSPMVSFHRFQGADQIWRGPWLGQRHRRCSATPARDWWFRPNWRHSPRRCRLVRR
jgi:poly(hydroxyalkanoate) depolymerase family esterase